MIEKIENLTENVVGLRAKGELTGDDYKYVIIPALEEAMKKNEKIRFLYVLGEDFDGFTAGAMWDDVNMALKNIKHFEKIAVVTKSKLVREAMTILGFLMPGEVRLFDNKEEEEAKDWISK